MRSNLSVVVFSRAAEFHEAVLASSQALTLARAERVDEFKDAVERLKPGAVVLHLASDADAILAAYESLSDRPALIACGPDDSRLIRQALRLGARDYLTLDQATSDHLNRSLATVASEQREKGAGEVGGAVVAVMGTKGGTGATFVACQVAAGLARAGAQVALVDLHLRGGDCALYLDLKPPYTLASIGMSERVDLAYLRTALAEHRSGLQLLAAPARPEDGDVVGAACVEKTLDLLRHDFDFLVLDLPREFDDRSMGALDLADLILLVATPEIPALNRAGQQLDLLTRLGHPAESIQIVLNRLDAGSLSLREIESFLSRPVDFRLANDYPRAARACSEGRAIWEVASRSALGNGMSELVSGVRRALGREEKAGATSRRRGLFQFLARKPRGAA